MPRLLDLFSGAGGAAKGYHRAGFEPYGIDNKAQPHYPFPFLQMDALEAIDRLLRGEGLTFSNGKTLYLQDFDAYHASPPCQGYSIMHNLPWLHGRDYPLLILPTLKRLKDTGKPYVVENVMGIDWMKRDELTQAIPPAYTEFTGKWLLRAIAEIEDV